ncbi:MAG TPA: peptide ABC transporter substrate-binding protein [Candidatus Aquilonibacter sp.]
MHGALDHPRSTLVIATTEEPDSLDPLLANLVSSGDVFALAYDGLVRFGPGGAILPDLAREVPSRANGGISADGRTIVYHLRRGVRWQDGVPFSARDVIFTWHALIDPRRNVPTHAGYDRIASIDAPDPWTVRVHLRERYAPMLSLFACGRQGAIVPAHRTNGNVGTGPYRIVAWHRGDEIVFERNHYTVGRSAFTRIELRFMHDEQSILDAMQNGDVDAALLLSTTGLDRARSNLALAVNATNTLEWEHLSFNLRPGSGPQANVHVRRAIAFALDPATLRRSYLYGFGGLAPLDQAPSSWARDPSIQFYPADLVAARRELAKAGYSNVALTLVSTTGNDERYRLELGVQSALRAIGIDLSIKNVPANLLLARAVDGGLLTSGKFQIALFSYVAISPDPNDERYVSSSAIPPNGVNMSAYANPIVDRLVLAGLATYDRRTRTTIYQAIQRRLIADLPFYTLVWTPSAIVARRDLRNVQAVPIGSNLWNAVSWSRAR